MYIFVFVWYMHLFCGYVCMHVCVLICVVCMCSICSCYCRYVHICVWVCMCVFSGDSGVCLYGVCTCFVGVCTSLYGCCGDQSLTSNIFPQSVYTYFFKTRPLTEPGGSDSASFAGNKLLPHYSQLFVKVPEHKFSSSHFCRSTLATELSSQALIETA